MLSEQGVSDRCFLLSLAHGGGSERWLLEHLFICTWLVLNDVIYRLVLVLHISFGLVLISTFKTGHFVVECMSAELHMHIIIFNWSKKKKKLWVIRATYTFMWNQELNIFIRIQISFWSLISSPQFYWFRKRLCLAHGVNWFNNYWKYFVAFLL